MAFEVSVFVNVAKSFICLAHPGFGAPGVLFFCVSAECFHLLDIKNKSKLCTLQLCLLCVVFFSNKQAPKMKIIIVFLKRETTSSNNNTNNL